MQHTPKEEILRHILASGIHAPGDRVVADGAAGTERRGVQGGGLDVGPDGQLHHTLMTAFI